MVTMRSLRFSMVRVAMIPGIAQANEDINGRKDLPLIPSADMNLSIMKAALDMYPQSSSTAMKKNRMAI